MASLGRSRTRPTKIFFASDIHGSEVTFRKFVAAARFYDTDALVIALLQAGGAYVTAPEQTGGRPRR